MGLVVLAPLFLVIATLIFIAMGRPILFRQLRSGLHGKPFTIFKFRSMRNPNIDEASIDYDGQRLTTFGKLLRAMSLDELPELWNVLRGEMSLVGPRPLLMDYLERYTPEEARRMEVRPGITGWAQVNGRNALSWDEKFRLDVWYVDHQSFGLDLRILAMTIVKVLSCNGISAESCATMPEFLGSGAKGGKNQGL